MRVSEVGEFGLISLLARELGIEYPPSPGARPRRGLLVDLGDDAVVAERRDGALIWTTDTLVAGVHFPAAQAPWTDIGWKALAVNVSDIAAMGGAPDLALVTLTLPGDFCVEDAVSLYQGLREAADAFGVRLAGGDLVGSPVFSVTVELCGWADLQRLGQPRAMTRSSARVGDIVAVSGALGDSAAGLRLVMARDSFESPAARRLREAHYRPWPRVDLGKAAIGAGVRCAIDISDGLVQDLGHIARASAVGIRVDAARVPLSAEIQELFGAQALGLALTGGEDYELALIGPRSAIESLLGRPELALTEVGEVVQYDSPRVAVVDESGRELALGAGGWDHFPASAGGQ
ncbi:MAG: thiamine-phosphate kinase [bacterium]|nr:thiamine-phosphate kinase [bacterium]